VGYHFSTRLEKKRSASPGPTSSYLDKRKVAGIVLKKQDIAQIAMDSRIYSKIFAVSGSLNALTHMEVKAALENRGGLLSKRVSKKTDYLIVGRQPGAMAITAKIYNVKILTESDLLNFLGINRQLTLNLDCSTVRQN
jgi:DNA ligase (NAD+)